MRTVKRFTLIITLALVLTILTGCGKENKYVNVGVGMSTPGLSLYLTNTAVELEKIATYVFFPQDPADIFDKIGRDKQGIDIAYIPVEYLSRIKSDSNFRVVFIDCFDDDGALKGVWIARDGWLESAPNYSARYILGLAKSVDYRASHMNMSYPDALASVKDNRDIDFTVQNDVLQFVAAFDDSNDDFIRDEAFSVRSASGLSSMFAGFKSGSGEGYELCRAAYDRYCTSSDSMSFDNMFRLDIMLEKLSEVSASK